MAGSTRTDAVSEPGLVPKLIRWPADWVAQIDAVRGDVSYSDFVRNTVRSAIDDGSLSDVPQWGQGRPKVPTPEEVIEEIRRLAEHETNRFAKPQKRSA